MKRRYEGPMPRFREGGECPKCYCQDIRARWCEGDMFNSSALCYGIRRDHHHRVCDRCHYEWLEGCHDDPEGWQE